MPFPSRDLTNQYISLSYQDVVQRYTPPGTSSYFLDGLGNELFVVDLSSLGKKVITVDQTASYALSAFNSITSSYAVAAVIAQVADVALIADTASVAISASYAPFQVSASYALTASFSLNGGGSSLTTGSTYPITSSWSNNSVSSSYANTATTANSINFVPQVAVSSSWASSSLSSSQSSNSISSSYALTSSYALNGGTGFSLTTGSTYPITSSWAQSVKTGDVSIIHADGKITYYSASVDSDSARGLALLSASFNTSDGDIIHLNKNTYDIGDNTLQIYGLRHLKGAGKYDSVIKGNLNGGFIVKTEDLSSISDLSVIATNSTVFQFPIGNTATSITSLDIKNVYVEGWTDCLYFATPMSELDNLRIDGVTLKTGWDALTIFLDNNGGNMYVNDTEIFVALDANIRYPRSGMKISSNGSQFVGVITNTRITTDDIGIDVSDDVVLNIEASSVGPISASNGAIVNVAPNVNFNTTISSSITASNPSVIAYNLKQYGDNLGIGTITHPLYKLDVKGDINFSGSLYNNGSPYVPSTSSYAVSSSVSISASYAPSSPSISASYALTASFALNGGSGFSLTTGSTYPITASWSVNSVTASNAISASYSLLTDSSSYSLLASSASYAISASAARSSSYSLLATTAGTASHATPRLFVNGHTTFTGKLVQDGCAASNAGGVSHGTSTSASGDLSHAEGRFTYSPGFWSHAEGGSTIALGDFSHAEGIGGISTGAGSHAEGYGTFAEGGSAHSEGDTTYAGGGSAHSEGHFTSASANYSHAEGQETIALGIGSHTEGIGTIASGSGQTVIGQYNLQNNSSSLFIIGNGISTSSRSDVVVVNSQSVYVYAPLFATASHAISASYAPTSPTISASYALTASVALNGGFSLTTGSTYPITASWSVNSLTASYLNGFIFNNTSSNITASQNIVVNQQGTGSLRAAFFDYVVSSGSNARAGTLFGTWTSNTMSFTEYSTTDIGNTTLVTMSVVISESFVQLITNAPTNAWSVISTGRYL